MFSDETLLIDLVGGGGDSSKVSAYTTCLRAVAQKQPRLLLTKKPLLPLIDNYLLVPTL